MEALDKMWAKKEAFDKEKEKAKEERFMASLEVEKAALELEKKRVENKAALEEKKVALEEKRCALEEKKAEADLLKEENAIMFVDKRTLDPLQLQYIEMMQLKIIARTMENLDCKTPKALSTSFLADSCALAKYCLLFPIGRVMDFTKVAHEGYIPSSR